MADDNWRLWLKNPAYGDFLYKRAVEDLEEMESSKALCDIVVKFYSKGMKVLDAGCAAGHYLTSLKKRIDPNIDYTGIDATAYYITLAKKAFPGEQRFFVGDICDIGYGDNSFDLVMCNNVIHHLPPPPLKAIEELIRVSKKYVVIRSVFGERNYIIKEIPFPNEVENVADKEIDLISSDADIEAYNFFNMYTEQYFRELIQNINPNIEINILPDTSWGIFDNRPASGDATGTRIMDGKQVSGNLILDWRFITLIKK